MKTSHTNRIRTSVSVALIALTLGTGIAVTTVETTSARTHAFVMERGLGYAKPNPFGTVSQSDDDSFLRRGIGFLKE